MFYRVWIQQLWTVSGFETLDDYCFLEHTKFDKTLMFIIFCLTNKYKKNKVLKNKYKSMNQES